jgi:hypothetical protein
MNFAHGPKTAFVRLLPSTGYIVCVTETRPLN